MNEKNVLRALYIVVADASAVNISWHKQLNPLVVPVSLPPVAQALLSQG